MIKPHRRRSGWITGEVRGVSLQRPTSKTLLYQRLYNGHLLQCFGAMSKAPEIG